MGQIVKKNQDSIAVVNDLNDKHNNHPNSNHNYHHGSNNR